MHASSRENMQSCFDRYIAGSALMRQACVRVLDIGGSDYNGSYRDIFADPRFAYTGADLTDGPGVHLVLTEPYRLPVDDRSIDIVLSGQMLEHCEFFWMAFAEMVRVLRPGGYLFLIAPSAGPEHRYPVDCYRFYPDAYRALARHANCALIEVWRDERGPWQDLVGVFQRHGAPPYAPPRISVQAPAPAEIAEGSAEEERFRGAVPYLDVLADLHRALAPACYLEIGVRHGRSLALARGPAIGVDPAPALTEALPPSTTIATQTSDAFFAAPAVPLPAIDFAFIDGLHHAEAALRDLMNIERRVAPGAVVVIDDVLPNHPAQAERDRRTRVWTGDVWKLVPLLRRLRPDLVLALLDTEPSGLLVIAGLNPDDRVLWDNYNPIVRELREASEPPDDVMARRDVVIPAGPGWTEFLSALTASTTSDARGEAVRRLSAPLPDQADLDTAKPLPLSVVVICHDMARELPRTIRSLSPEMQRGIAAEDYEIIVVDNGSATPPSFDEVARWASNARLLLADDPQVSPVAAINQGLAHARGELVGVMIDGARMASPGLLATALAASRTGPRTAVGTLAFHLGPDVQMRSVLAGYDQAAEDRLLETAGWETDPYRLFDISVFSGSSAGGWFSLPAETNALFLAKTHWHEIGGYDPAFRMPGGGLVNLDTWRRLCADPTAHIVMLLGEATFHQVHGGVATNAVESPWERFHTEYAAIRGTDYAWPTASVTYYGSLPRPPARLGEEAGDVSAGEVGASPS